MASLHSGRRGCPGGWPSVNPILKLAVRFGRVLFRKSVCKFSTDGPTISSMT
jgi:hypothetical protein